MASPSRWTKVAAAALMAAAALLMTGSAASAEPEPAKLELRIVVDDCPKTPQTSATQP